MLSAAEKLKILKKVSMFAQTPEDMLTNIIDIVEEIKCDADEIIFEKGDIGTCMYIIIEGRVRVHDEERTLNFLGKGNVFGEMAALDPEPRSASITTLEETYLFRLDREPLYELISRQMEVVYGIIRVLCQHLRARIRDLAEDYKYMQQFARVTAAASAVEAGIFAPESLDEVALREDELGQLARVFQRMTREVAAREFSLKQQVQVLQIEIDQVKQARQVVEITETDYFRDLQTKARLLKQRAKHNEQP